MVASDFSWATVVGALLDTAGVTVGTTTGYEVFEMTVERAGQLVTVE